MEHIDAIYFINLDHRADRLQEFTQEMEKIGFPKEKIHRVSGIYRPDLGCLGCSKSHVKALTLFLESNYSNCIVFEDDFFFYQDINYCKFLFKHFFERVKQYDLLMLAGNIMKDEATESPFIRRVLDGQTTSAYLVTREFAKPLLENYKAGVQELENWFSIHKDKKHDYCLDIYWKLLQPSSKWYILNPKMGMQRESYSDIEQKVTNYRV